MKKNNLYKSLQICLAVIAAGMFTACGLSDVSTEPEPYVEPDIIIDDDEDIDIDEDIDVDEDIDDDSATDDFDIENLSGIGKLDTNYEMNEEEARAFFDAYIASGSVGRGTLEMCADTVTDNQEQLMNIGTVHELYHAISRRYGEGNQYVKESYSDAESLIADGIITPEEADAFAEKTMQNACLCVYCSAAQSYLDDFFGKDLVNVYEWDSYDIYVSSTGYLFCGTGIGGIGDSYEIKNVECSANLAFFECEVYDDMMGEYQYDAYVTLYKDETGVHFYEMSTSA